MTVQNTLILLGILTTFGALMHLIVTSLGDLAEERGFHYNHHRALRYRQTITVRLLAIAIALFVLGLVLPHLHLPIG